MKKFISLLIAVALLCTANSCTSAEQNRGYEAVDNGRVVELTIEGQPHQFFYFDECYSHGPVNNIWPGCKYCK